MTQSSSAGAEARMPGGACALVQAWVARELPLCLEWEVLCSVWGWLSEKNFL